MFRALSQEILEVLLKKVINDCLGNTNYVSTVIKLMDKKSFGQHLLLIVLKKLLVYMGLHGLNPITVVLKKITVLEGIYGAMQQLMRRHHKLMLQNNEIIFKQYLEMRVIEQSHTIATNLQDTFLDEASKVLCVKS